MNIKIPVIDFTKQHELFQGGRNVVVALSGGTDSVALLDFCLRYKNELGLGEVTAAHFNHCLRGEESEADQQFCRQLCGDFGVPFFTESADVAGFAASSGQSVEMAARELRYAFLRRIANQNNAVIATAHHADDNAETLLINLLRGTGLAGLGGMAPSKNDIVRPFLCCDKADLLEYCHENELSYVTDSSNNSDAFTRNFLRMHVFPCFSKVNPSWNDTFRHEMTRFQEDEKFLSSLAKQALQKAKRADEYDVEMLAELASPLLSRAVMQIFAEHGVTPFESEIDRVMRLLVKKSGHERLRGLDFGICKGRLFVCQIADCMHEEGIKQELFIGENPFKNVKIILKYSDNIEKNDAIPFIFSLNYGKIKGNVTVRERQTGDRISLVGAKGSKSLKKLFNEKGIAATKRSEILVFCDDDGVIAVQGFGVDKRVEPETGQDTLIVQIES